MKKETHTQEINLRPGKLTEGKRLTLFDYYGVGQLHRSKGKQKHKVQGCLFHPLIFWTHNHITILPRSTLSQLNT